jgi:anti-sigma regulatory factor (Ser/Thr protein kinase)
MRSVLVRLDLPARRDSVPEHAAAIEQAIPADLRGELVRIGLVEALMNAVVHGALGVQRTSDLDLYLDTISELDHPDPPTVSATVRVADGRCQVLIEDGGEGFDWRAASPRRGRGLSILREVFDDVTWNDRGNEVRLSLRGGSP